MTSSPLDSRDHHLPPMNASRPCKPARPSHIRPDKRSSRLSHELSQHSDDERIDSGADDPYLNTTRPPSPSEYTLTASSTSPSMQYRDAVLQRAISSSSRRSHFMHPPAYDTHDHEERIQLPPLEPAGKHGSCYPPPRSSTPLSVYKLPTGTYMWPSFKPSSQMTYPPVLYVEYKDAGSPASEPESDNHSVQSSLEGTPPPPAYNSASCSRKRRPSTDAPSPQLGSTIIEPLRKVRVSSGRLSDRQLPENRITSQSNVAKGESKDVVYSRGHINYILNDTDDARSDTQGRSSPTFSRSHSSGSFSASSTPRASTPVNATAVSENWEIYARQVKRHDGSLAYQCLWSTKDNDSSTPCMYTSKKQLVKRHVETTHLKVKRFICDICSKAFPQKTSLDIHRHGHTGDTPHVCIYNCGKAFKDPARRHRHHIEAHGYVPKQFKRKYKASIPNQEQSEYESLEPWRPIEPGGPRGVR